MKTYQANDQLAAILLKHGLVKTNPESKRNQKNKCERGFKLSMSARKEICFYDGQVHVLHSKRVQDSKKKLTETDLRVLLLYFKLDPKDYNLIETDDKFNFEKVIERIKKIRVQLKDLERLNMHRQLRIRLARILDTYETILD